MAIEQQFALSPHGDAYIRASSSCINCHTSQGFVANATGGTADFTGGAAQINCRTCHQIHQTYEGQDFALTTTDPVKLIVASTASTDSIVDVSGDDTPGSNMCANCHQARTEDAWPNWEAALTDSFALGNHYDFHHGPQTNVYTAELPESVEFGETTTGMFASHEDVSCLGCHMGIGVTDFTPSAITPGGELGHNWAPSTDVCATCHDADFDYGGIQTQVATDHAALTACLEAEGVIEQDAEGEYHGVVASHPEPYVAAFLVWSVAAEDGSMGVHQPRYLPDLVANALAYMETNSALCPVVAP